MQTTETPSADEIIAEMTRRIVEQFDPLQVILFGSRLAATIAPTATSTCWSSSRTSTIHTIGQSKLRVCWVDWACPRM